MYGTLSKSAFKLFQQSAAFQPCLELKAKEAQVSNVTEYKLLQILGEGYEGKVRLRVRVRVRVRVRARARVRVSAHPYP